CCWLWQVRFQASHPARVDEWIPVCTGMTVGGVTGADFLCETVLLVFSIILCFLTFSFSLRSVGLFLSISSSSSRTWGSIVQRVL
ncbi:TPA: hypothetical protein I7707_21580, partial [Vibrio vulnificus]|nr:hypothetical protein [Vibrio vulnificus]